MPPSPTAIVDHAKTADDIAAVARLFTDYVASLPIDIAYQNFDAELASLPGKYSKGSGGAVLLGRASSKGEAVGCIAIRGLNSSRSCELKRLYVTQEGRGLGMGKMLLEAALVCAKELGYNDVLLDTLPTMEAARALYQRYGFTEISPYYDTPIEGTIFLGKRL